jgi:hypothetical protein
MNCQWTFAVGGPKAMPWSISAMISAVWEISMPERLKKRLPSAKTTLPD